MTIYRWIMLWLSAVFVAAVSNLDNLGAGIALGMRGARVRIQSNLVIAAMTMAGTAAAMSSGRALSRLMPPSLPSALGSLIMIAIGMGTIVATLQTVGRPSSAPSLGGRVVLVPGGSVCLREALALGVALSLNNMGSGIGAGIAGVPPVPATFLAGGFSMVCVGAGARVGSSVGRLLIGRQAPLVGGLALVGVGAAMLAGVG